MRRAISELLLGASVLTRASATRTLGFTLLCIGSGLMLAVAFPRPAWAAGAWVALAP